MNRLLLSFVILLLLQVQLSAQSGHPYKNLVLEGGGIRGFAYPGAFEVLDSLQILQHIERVGGSSAGAIQAMLLALGYSTKEMMALAATIPLKKFNDGFFAAGFSRMKHRFGFFKGQKIMTWVEELIATKTGDANITFLQLHRLKHANNYKDLYIAGTDLTYRCLRIFSYESYPNMRVKDALRISFSIPLYYEPVFIDDAGAVQSKTASANLHFMVDGGLLSNYPIQMFDSTKYADGNDSSNRFQPNLFTLGLLLDKPDQLNYGGKQPTPPLPISNLRGYLSAVYQTIIDKPNPDVATLRRTITISHLNLSGRVRRLPAATIQQLAESGREGVRAFFFR